jgi:hypothetical protein
VSEPIPVAVTGRIVECAVCHKHMVIANGYIEWQGHPGYKHPEGHPDCRPSEIKT